MNILITGKGSYIGNSIKDRLEKTGDFKVAELDLLDDAWTGFDFSPYDSVIHVAALVHRQKEHINWDTYYKVNALLPEKIAKAAKAAGVGQFIFLSTMAVYGQDKKLPSGNVIRSDTPFTPGTDYGRSKYEAELLLTDLRYDNFKICIVRPPNVYGKNCMGNYFSGFVKITKFLSFFPKAFESSKQSFLFVDNLAEFIRFQIVHGGQGVFMPQDGPPVSTVEFIRAIAKALNKRVYFSRVLGAMIRPFSRISIVNKVYGGVSYDIDLSGQDYEQCAFCSSEEGIRKSLEQDHEK
jgi:UDP-glucose 4-epimerase